MDAAKELQIKYIDDVNDPVLVDAACSIPEALGYDKSADEHFLCGNVLTMRWVSDESAVELFALRPDELEGCPATLIRVEYEAWSTESPFNPAKPEFVVYRREHIFVRASVLLEGSIATYGLGPEYGFDLWTQDDVLIGYQGDLKLPPEAITELANELKSNRLSEIMEFLDSEPMPERLSKQVHEIYNSAAKRLAIEAVAAEELANEVRRVRAGGELRFNLRQGSIHNEPDGVRLNVPSSDQSHRLEAVVHFGADTKINSGLIEVSLVRRGNSGVPLNVKVRDGKIPISTCLSRVDVINELKAALLDQRIPKSVKDTE